ncbi:hypothetical protein [Aliarcobacter butzleri]|uniref:hypothetical protein n=1 Tax=Aliarcobacter butzleri TaxID=28197 RepID=UPI00125FBA79|nr:hypothetical protein [Aliarcobacter butzleri]
MGYLYILGTILFTVYGQLVLKWRIVKYGAMPEDFIEKLVFLFKLLFDPLHISEYSDRNAGVQPDTFAMRFSRV